MLKLKTRKLKPYAVVVWLCCTLICLSFIPSDVVKKLDLTFLDQDFTLLRSFATKAIDNDVAVIGIDEQTYKTYPEPFALWHTHLAELFRALALAKPKVVGLDIGFPDRSYDAVIPGSDKQLLTGILVLKQVAPLILGITVEQSGKARPVYAPFLSVAGADAHAYVLWQLDIDRVIRRYQNLQDVQDNVLPTLARTMAKHLRISVSEGLIDYSVGAQMHYIPMQQVLAWYQENNLAQLESVFKDKAVLLGTILPFEDRHYQPVNLAAWETQNRNHLPGVLIHAQALRSLLAQGFVTEAPTLLIISLVLVISMLWWLRLKIWQSVTLLLLILLSLLVLQLRFLWQGFYIPVTAVALSGLLMLAGKQIYIATLLVLERQRLKNVFSGYVSPQVMREILLGHLKPGVHGERKILCVLFSDIRNFTSISEKLAPEQVIRFLGLYLEAMVTAIQQHEGTIDKFMGDGIMAFFGAPKTLENPCQNAFLAAKAKLSELAELNLRMQNDPDFPQLHIGIGLHVGEAVVGNIGSTQRNEYTAIGDVVNTGSRLEGLTKQLGYPLVVSQAFVEQLTGNEQFDDLGEIPVKGRAPVRVFGWPPKRIEQE